MGRIMSRLPRFLAVLAIVLIAAAVILRVTFGGGQRLEDRTAAPELSGSVLEKVVDLDYPPGNVAVSADGRVFFTLHPDGDPPAQVLELAGGKPVAYPDTSFQEDGANPLAFQSILSIRIDRQNRLWVLDYAKYGRGQPRLLAFDLATNALVHQYDFPSSVAGLLSMLNDFQVDPAGERIYIAETSPILQRPALIVYDVASRTARRVLEGHSSLQAEDYVIQAPGRDMVAFGFYTLRIPVDSIALDKRGEWLYFGPVSGDRLYRIARRDLDDAGLSAETLAARVQDYGPKTLSDGITMDVADNVYLSDMEHSAVVLLGPDRRLSTLLKDPRLRWPDGFSFAPDGWLYVTCSSLQDVLFISRSHMREHAPYQIFRFKPGREGFPGH